jgi:predicted LPLAT superfamily acyltransferase
MMRRNTTRTATATPGRRPEGGGRFAIWLIRDAARLFGRRFVRAFLYPITLYFYLRRGVERRASAAYLARIGRPAGRLAVLAHLHAFASVVLDRVFLLTCGFAPFDIRVHGYEQLQAQLERGGGAMLLGAHVGSFETLNVLKQERPQLVLKFVMDKLQTQACNGLLYSLNPDVGAQIIEVGSDPVDFALQLQAVAQGGGVIGLLGDRIRAGELAVSAPFLGAPADFPAAPYLIASMLKLPIVLGFGIYRGGNRYDLHFELFAAELRIERGQRDAQLRAAAQRYAARLEHYLRTAPYNWFNFHDFWQRAAAVPGVDAGRLADRAAA